MKPIKKNWCSHYFGALVFGTLGNILVLFQKMKSELQFRRLDSPCSYQQFHRNFTWGLSFAFQARDTPHPIPKLNPSLFCSACEQNFGQPMINTANDQVASNRNNFLAKSKEGVTRKHSAFRECTRVINDVTQKSL